MTHTEDEWSGCYGGGWGTILSQESYAHPAKVSKNLAERIYSHVIAEGWAKQGSRVIDPFGGIGGFAYYAMINGLHFVGVELESRFVTLGQGTDCDGHTCPECSAPTPETDQASMFTPAERAPHRYHGNIERWEQKGFKGTARLLNGDSRRLVSVIREANLSLTSPPYGQRTVHGQPGIDLTKNPNDRTGVGSQIHTQDKYGDEPGQLGNLPMKDLDLSVSSPPYIDSVNQSDGANDSTARKKRKAKAGVDISKSINVGGPNSVLEATEDGLSVAISSPPYAGVSDKHDRTGAERARRRHERLGFKQGIGCFKASEAYGDSEGQLGGMDEGNLEANLVISSPPYTPEALGHKGKGNEIDKKKGLHSRMAENQYGETEGQISQMKTGDADLAISSPPYINSVNAGDHGIDWSKVDRSNPNTGNRKRGEDSKHGKTLRAHLAYTEKDEAGYGRENGQVGQMKEGDIDASITSPPYEASHVTGERNFTGGGGNETPARGINREGYGVDEAQITKEAETFWSASRLILEQLYSVLVPGGAAVFVVKSFVRKGVIVDFPGQWARLCEAVGFVWLHDHHALLEEHYGTQGGFEKDKEITVKRASFFRRLHEAKNPETAIKWESVLCFKKPA